MVAECDRERSEGQLPGLHRQGIRFTGLGKQQDQFQSEWVGGENCFSPGHSECPLYQCFAYDVLTSAKKQIHKSGAQEKATGEQHRSMAAQRGKASRSRSGHLRAGP